MFSRTNSLHKQGQFYFKELVLCVRKPKCVLVLCVGVCKIFGSLLSLESCLANTSTDKKLYIISILYIL